MKPKKTATKLEMIAMNKFREIEWNLSIQCLTRIPNGKNIAFPLFLQVAGALSYRLLPFEGINRVSQSISAQWSFIHLGRKDNNC